MTSLPVIRELLQALFSFDEAHPLLFTQFYFWAFFALVFALFSLCHSKPVLRNAYLFFVSLFFYYKTSGVFLILLVFVVVYNYFAARWLHVARGRWKTFWLVLSVVVDLGVLAYFKYAYFLADFLNQLFGLSIEVHDVLGELGNMVTGSSVFRADAIILPVGISFFTFQAISYIVDVKRGKIAPLRKFLDFGFFLTFFPQLVAGPIVRATDFVPQIRQKLRVSPAMFAQGVLLVVMGLVKKAVVSDYISLNFVDRVFDNPQLFTGGEVLLGLYGYSMMYRETGEARYLAQAMNIGDMLLSRLPDDGIPYWDFDDPQEEPLRDVSAAAIMASAFIQLSEQSGNMTYWDMAEKQLCTMLTPEYLATPGTNGGFLLKHGVGNLPEGSEVDVPLTYADYYFLEALVRYWKHEG